MPADLKRTGFWSIGELNANGKGRDSEYGSKLYADAGDLCADVEQRAPKSEPRAQGGHPLVWLPHLIWIQEHCRVLGPPPHEKSRRPALIPASTPSRGSYRKRVPTPAPCQRLLPCRQSPRRNPRRGRQRRCERLMRLRAELDEKKAARRGRAHPNWGSPARACERCSAPSRRRWCAAQRLLLVGRFRSPRSPPAAPSSAPAAAPMGRPRHCPRRRRRPPLRRRPRAPASRAWRARTPGRGPSGAGGPGRP